LKYLSTFADARREFGNTWTEAVDSEKNKVTYRVGYHLELHHGMAIFKHVCLKTATSLPSLVVEEKEQNS
jgi:hypothetical protein